MERNVGSRFGPYEIIAALGTGGMGEVYRATDMRLQRDVALKILTAETAEDSQRHRRFLQEARAASSLNHPNILVVYDVGSENGSQFIVSELVEGESLRSLIQKGALPLRRFLEIAIQVASGLTTAHEAGIVHRDLKPENIMVGRDNRVKILDFGLAKITLPQTGAPEDQTRSHLTMPGAILGTVAYMSPEQARGSDVDFRSDQFSFGLILYEMATGKKAFYKDTPVQTLSAIITEDPPSISTLNKKFPGPIRWMIERCLAKDRRDRYGATIDLYHELRDFREHLSESSFSGETTPASAGRKSKAGLWIAAAVLLAVATGFLIAALLMPRNMYPLDSYSFTPIAVSPGLEGFGVWSPDGNSIAYIGEVEGVQQLFIRSLASPSSVQITRSVKDVLSPYWSPDGSRIYYTSEEANKIYNLWSIGIAGGSPEIVIKNAGSGAISPDGKTRAFFRPKSKENKTLTLWTQSNSSGQPKEIQDAQLQGWMLEYAQASFSPDGTKLFVNGKAEGTGVGYWLVPVAGGKPQELEFLRGLSSIGVSWMPDGKRLVIALANTERGHHLWMVDLECRCKRPITNGVAQEWGPAVSPDGSRILFTSIIEQFDLVSVPLDGSDPQHLTDTPVNEKAPSWSPRGNQFAFVSDITGADVIWVKSETEGWKRPLVTQKDFPDKQTLSFSRPSFSPDGQRIIYHRNVINGITDLWISNVAGGPPVRLYAESRAQFAPTWSPDGNSVAYMSGRKGSFSLAKARVGSSEAPVILREDVNYFQPQWAPDGSWILFMTQEGMFLISPDGKTTKPVSNKQWLTGGWSQDGKLLYSVQQTDKRRLVLVSVDPETGKEELIVDAGVSPLLLSDSAFAGYSLAPDGKSFATSILQVKGDLWILEGFDPKPRSLFWFLSHKKEDGKEKTTR